MVRAGAACLGVDDHGVAALDRDQVRLPGQHGRGSPEPKGVLVFGKYFVAQSFPALPCLIDQCRMLEHPPGGVEIGWRLRPVPVVGAEPPGPLAVGLSGRSRLSHVAQM